MHFVIAPEIFARFPGMRVVVAVAEGVNNITPRPLVDALWDEAWGAAGDLVARYPNTQSHPHVAPWREAFKGMGLSSKDFRSSIEAILRRAVKGGEPFRISPLVDFYNAVSLRHIAPAGGFDLAALADPLELRPSRAGETFLALGADAPDTLAPGEVSYVSDGAVLTRHFVWRQAQRGALTPATRGVFLVSEILGEVERHGGGTVADAVLSDFCAGLRDHFGVTPRPFLLDADNPGCAW